MLRERYLRVYDLHSWTGIVLGLFIFIVSLTGCFALFDHEIKTWENDRLRLTVPKQIVPINDKFQRWVSRSLGSAKPDFVGFVYPSKHEPYYLARLQYQDENKQAVRKQILWNSATGDVIPERGNGLSEWVLDFHRDLMWPEFLGGRQAGRAIVGIAGIVLMLSIISGILTHTKIIREFLTLRFKNTIRLKWTDTHKVLGLWTLPFSIMISFTGAFLGIITILSPIIAVLAFKGDTEALIKAVVGAPQEPTQIEAPMLSVDHVVRQYENARGQSPGQIVIQNWGDETAEYLLFFEVENELARFERTFISGVSGETIKVELTNELTPPNRVSAAVAPLHYGTYGNIWLKWLYFLLGISLSVITATGLMMWIERRLHGKEGSMSTRYYQRLGRLVIGTTLGLPIASVSLFYLDKLYSGVEADRLSWTGITYFLVWFVVMIYAFITKLEEYRLVRRLLFLASLACIGLPVLNWLTTRSWFLSEFEFVWAKVDFAFLLLGLVALVTTVFLPSERVQPERERGRQAPSSAPTPTQSPA